MQIGRGGCHPVEHQKTLATTSRRPADDVKLHEVGRSANAHRRARYDSDDVALAHQPLFQQALLRNLGQPVHLLHVLNHPG